MKKKEPKRRANRGEPEIDPELARQLQEEAADLDDLDDLGYSTDPEDSIWCGEDGSLDPNDWIYDHLGRRHPLENILLAIIAAHPSESRDTADVRLESALKTLVSFRRRRGKKPKRREKLIKIAREYWKELCAGTDEPKLAGIIREHAIDLKNLTTTQENNLIADWRDAFNAEKDSLLRAVTGESDEAQADRRYCERKVLELLNELGIPSVNLDRG